MYLNGKRIEDIDSNDIKRLISNEIAESKILEYKRELKIDLSGDKKEFLYDIAAMGNTEGGNIIYGIEEGKNNGQNTGIPKEIIGLSINNEDKLKQQIEDIIRNNIEPKLNSAIIRVLNVDDKSVLIIGINKSIGLPHMVTFNSSNKFYKRKMTGKYLLDVYELNSAFIGNWDVKERANNFRKGRIREVMDLKFYPNIDVENSFFLHILPLGQLNELSIDIIDENRKKFLIANLKPLYGHLYNIDGFMTFDETIKTQENRKIHTYTQLFRDCSLEFYTNKLTDILYDVEPSRKKIDGFEFENTILDKLLEAFKIFNFYQIEPPFAIYISLFGLKGSKVFQKNEYSYPLNKEEILLPAVILNNIVSENEEGAKAKLYQIMKPVFDMFWQMAGLPESPYSNAQR